jgi:hypothetical protein
MDIHLPIDPLNLRTVIRRSFIHQSDREKKKQERGSKHDPNSAPPKNREQIVSVHLTLQSFFGP